MILYLFCGNSSPSMETAQNCFSEFYLGRTSAKLANTNEQRIGALLLTFYAEKYLNTLNYAGKIVFGIDGCKRVYDNIYKWRRETVGQTEMCSPAADMQKKHNNCTLHQLQRSGSCSVSVNLRIHLQSYTNFFPICTGINCVIFCVISLSFGTKLSWWFFCLVFLFCFGCFAGCLVRF